MLEAEFLGGLLPSHPDFEPIIQAIRTKYNLPELSPQDDPIEEIFLGAENMADQNAVFPLSQAYREFAKLLDSLSNEQFLTPMNGWTPRDVAAHLVGWNSLMIEAALSIMAGSPPAYYEDAPNDYSNINAGFTAKFSSESKRDLLADLRSSMEKLERFLSSLSTEELAKDHGVKHHSGSPATVTRIIESLASDYQYHTNQIEEWFDNL